MSTILVVEDNAELAAVLRYNLQLEGHAVEVAGTGEDGLASARARTPDLIILDLMLPGVDGFETLRALRSEGMDVPVMILSARGEETDIIRGFRLDADQYVTKPFRLLEILERVRTLLRRRPTASAGDAPEVIRFGAVEVETASHQVRVDGEPVSLTPRAYALMLALVRRDGAVASRQELLREVWGHRGAVLTCTVDAHMAELRRKVEADPAQPRHFLTVWKAGYRFSP